jgi:hypothetical protein
MSRTSLIAVVIVTVASAIGCSSTSVQSDFDHQVNFTKYSTFAWYVKPEKDKPPSAGRNQIIDGRIRRAIAEDLIGKGFSQTSPEKADVFVTYYMSLNSQLRMYAGGWGYGWGYGPYWRYGYGYWPGWGYPRAYTYHEGTIIIDIIDGGKRRLVWRGSVTRALTKKSSSEEKIAKSVTRVMLGFPPT